MFQKPWLIKALRNPYRAFCCYSNVSSVVSTWLIIENKLSKQQSIGIVPFLSFWIVLRHLAVIHFWQFRLKPGVESCDTSHVTADSLPRLDYKLRNDYGIFCFPQALNPPPSRSISINFSITDLDRSQLLRNFHSFFKAVHSTLTT